MTPSPPFKDTALASLSQLMPSPIRRDIAANAVSVNAQKVQDEQMQLTKGEYILQVGKRKFAKLKVL